jgi:DNA polymerase delta subunit 3
MTSEDDSTSSGKVYGMIANPGVRRRERKGGMPKAAPAAPISKTEPKAQVKQESQPAVKEEPKAAKTAPTKDVKGPVATAAKKAAAAPALKRQGSSGGIGQMFAKAAAKPKKPASRTTSNTPPVVDTPSPALSDDGEDDSEMPDVKPDPVAAQARKSRQNELRKMMEDSDEEIDSKPETPAEEPEEQEETPVEPEPKADEGPSEVISSTGNGRKRGKRRITKKVTKMDDQGYLSKLA